VKEFEGKCDCCGDQTIVRTLEDKKLNLSLTVCKNCIIYAHESTGCPEEDHDNEED